jgi:hypothetical protein
MMIMIVVMVMFVRMNVLMAVFVRVDMLMGHLAGRVDMGMVMMMMVIVVAAVRVSVMMGMSMGMCVLMGPFGAQLCEALIEKRRADGDNRETGNRTQDLADLFLVNVFRQEKSCKA